MNISERGLELIREFEGCKLVAYLDAVGIPTIGYGHTAGVQQGDVIEESQAEEWLREDVHVAERCIDKLVTVPVTQGEFDALCSFVFNLGCTALRNSTLLRKLNAADYDGAASEFRKWTHAGGKELPGLIRRRVAEAKRFEEAV